VAGVLFASVLLQAFGHAVSGFLGIPLSTEVSFDEKAYAIAAVLVIASAVLFGTIPVLSVTIADSLAWT